MAEFAAQFSARWEVKGEIIPQNGNLFNDRILSIASFALWDPLNYLPVAPK